MKAIAVDTSSMIAFLQNEGDTEDVVNITKAIQNEQLALPPPVLSELLSDSQLPQNVANGLIALPQLPIKAGFWERTGFLRASILAERKKARLADTLIAQCCIDNQAPLITRDKDFRHFISENGLDLLLF